MHTIFLQYNNQSEILWHWMQLIVIALVAYGYLPRMSKIAMQQYSGDFVEAPGLLLARGVVDGIICMMNVVLALFASILGT